MELLRGAHDVGAASFSCGIGATLGMPVPLGAACAAAVPPPSLADGAALPAGRLLGTPAAYVSCVQPAAAAFPVIFPSAQVFDMPAAAPQLPPSLLAALAPPAAVAASAAATAARLSTSAPPLTSFLPPVAAVPPPPQSPLTAAEPPAVPARGLHADAAAVTAPLTARARPSPLRDADFDA